MDPSSNTNLSIKNSNIATQNNPTAGPILIKTKRKYKKREKVEPIVNPILSVQFVKPKRKYTRKNVVIYEGETQPLEVLPKPKRKYTRKIKIEAKKISPMNDIKLSPQSPIIMLQNMQQSPSPLQNAVQPTKPRLNEVYISLMQDLAFVMRKNKDFMRAKAYDNARETISSISEDITSPTQLQNKPGIGKTIYQKLHDFLNTGTLNVLERNKEVLAKKRTIDIFLNVYGIGEKKAEELVDQGILTISQLKEQQDTVLNDKQKIGLKYYEDILLRIPRTEIEQYEKIFLESSKNRPSLKLQIVGSYRRGLESSGDIDVILTSTNSNDFKNFVDNLIEKKIILEVLSRGPSKCLVVAKLPEIPHARRVDFLFTSPKEFPFSILYFTGSKGFNTAMREHALKMNLTLNEHGFSTMEGRKKGDMIDVVFPDEKSIFDYLHLEYKEPKDRIDGKQIHLVGQITPKPVVIEQKPGEPVEQKRKTLKIRVKKEDILSKIEDFKTKGIQVLENSNEQTLTKMVEHANKAFHDKGEPVMTDAEYDILRDFIEKKYPKNKVIQIVGAEVEKNKAVLPYEMASMDKIKPDSGALQKWIQKYTGPYLVSTKLDGVSGLYITENGEPKLYTRGDGKIGQDISYLIPHLKLPKDVGLAIRGEFIIKKSVFEEKYKSKFSNSRNLVAGIVNAKSVDNKIRDVDFVAYEVIKPENLTPSKQMEKLLTLDIHTVKHSVLCELSNDKLSEILQDWRSSKQENAYEIDGIIVSDDKVYPRTLGNPEHSFAFKMVLSDQIAETHVLDVEWNVSKDGYLKPRVRVNEVELGGVKINYVTGINGAFIEKNRIGVGAIIKIIRSGDVIPKIESVTSPAENPKMPNIPYAWNSTHIDLILTEEGAEDNITMREKQIAQFFKGIEVDGLGPGNVTKIVKAGNDTICKILDMTEPDFLKVEGFQKKTAEKLYQGIQNKIKQASFATIMAVSNKFGRGFGKERIEIILKEYPNVLDPSEQKLDKLKKVKGIADKTAREFIENIPKFLEFLKDCKLEYKMSEKIPENGEQGSPKEIDKSNPLYEKKIVMTGFRDKDLETKLNSLGAKLSSSVNKNTFLVLVKTMDETTGKMDDAKKLNIPIISLEDFCKKYLSKVA